MRALVIAATLAATPALAQQSPVKEAERLAAEAMATAAARPDAALAAARRALALTAEFQPTSFVRAGRRGEVVEDEYTAARTEYRRHRAPVYEAMGVALAAQGHHEAAARYLRRALVLDPDDARAGRLVGSLLALGRGGAALDVLHERGQGIGRDRAAAGALRGARRRRRGTGERAGRDRSLAALRVAAAAGSSRGTDRSGFPAPRGCPPAPPCASRARRRCSISPGDRA